MTMILMFPPLASSHSDPRTIPKQKRSSTMSFTDNINDLATSDLQILLANRKLPTSGDRATKSKKLKNYCAKHGYKLEYQSLTKPQLVVECTVRNIENPQRMKKMELIQALNVMCNSLFVFIFNFIFFAFHIMVQLFDFRIFLI